MSLDWKGDEVIKRMQSAARYGVNKTMAECVAIAKGTHPFTNRTAMAERSIRIVMPAKTEKVSGTTIGIWGSINVAYFWALEFGTRLTKTRVSIRQRTRIMKTGIVKRPENAGMPPWSGGSWAPTLRPAAQKIYPRLAQNIREGWARAG